MRIGPWAMAALLVASVSGAGGQGRGAPELPDEVPADAVAVGHVLLPPGAIGVHAIVDWTTSSLAVSPLLATEAPAARSGCSPTGSYQPSRGTWNGWAVAPPARGDREEGCTHQDHEGPIRTQELVCVSQLPGSSVCGIDAVRRADWTDIVMLWCHYAPTAFVLQRNHASPAYPKPAAGDGWCWIEENWGLLPAPMWDGYDSLVYASPETDVLGLNNGAPPLLANG